MFGRRTEEERFAAPIINPRTVGFGLTQDAFFEGLVENPIDGSVILNLPNLPYAKIDVSPFNGPKPLEALNRADIPGYRVRYVPGEVNQSRRMALILDLEQLVQATGGLGVYRYYNIDRLQAYLPGVEEINGAQLSLDMVKGVVVEVGAGVLSFLGKLADTPILHTQAIPLIAERSQGGIYILGQYLNPNFISVPHEWS